MGTWHGETWHGETWHGETWHGETWHGETWHGETWHGETWHGETWHEEAWHGETWHGETWHGETWHGETWHEEAWHGETWHGETWHGETLINHDNLFDRNTVPNLFQNKSCRLQHLRLINIIKNSFPFFWSVLFYLFIYFSFDINNALWLLKMLLLVYLSNCVKIVKIVEIYLDKWF